VTVKYALTRAEIFRALFKSFKTSPKFLAMIILFSIVLGFLPLLTGGSSRPLGFSDLRSLCASSGVAFLFLISWTVIRGKKDERALTISTFGVSTQIGSQAADIPWASIAFISPAKNHLLIVRKTGNAFFIPGRAFADAAQQERFVELVEAWRREG